MLVAPNFAAKKKRQCYAHLGGGQLSVASTTLLESIVARAKSWAVGACAAAAAALLGRADEDGHRVAPRADLWIAADDAAEDEGKLAMLLGEETADGGAAGAAGRCRRCGRCGRRRWGGRRRRSGGGGGRCGRGPGPGHRNGVR